MNFLQASITSAVFIASIATVRALTKHRLPARFFLLLWAVAAVKLILPVSFTSAFSIYNLVVYHGANSVFNLTSYANTTAGDLVTLLTLLLTGPGGLSNSLIIFLWILGAALTGVFFLTSVHRYHQIIRMAIPVPNNTFPAGWLAGQGLRRKLRILTSDRLETPIAAGLFRPMIILPKFMDLNDTPLLISVLEHELVHIRRFHVFWKFLMICVLVCHWFNPAVWLMYCLLNRDLELSCDASVLRKKGAAFKGDYARALVGMAQLQKAQKTLGIGFALSSAEERLVSIMKFRKSSRAAVCAAAVLLLGLTLTFATTSNSTYQASLTINGSSTAETIFNKVVCIGSPYHFYYYTDDLPNLF